MPRTISVRYNLKADMTKKGESRSNDWIFVSPDKIQKTKKEKERERRRNEDGKSLVHVSTVFPLLGFTGRNSQRVTGWESCGFPVITQRRSSQDGGTHAQITDTSINMKTRFHHDSSYAATDVSMSTSLTDVIHSL